MASSKGLLSLAAACLLATQLLAPSPASAQFAPTEPTATPFPLTPAELVGKYCLAEYCLGDPVSKHLDALQEQQRPPGHDAAQLCTVINQGAHLSSVKFRNGGEGKILFLQAPSADAGAQWIIHSILFHTDPGLGRDQVAELQQSLVSRMGLEPHLRVHRSKLIFRSEARRSGPDEFISLSVVPVARSRTWTFELNGPGIYSAEGLNIGFSVTNRQAVMSRRSSAFTAYPLEERIRTQPGCAPAEKTSQPPML